MNVQGYIQFNLTLGDTTLPVEAFVIPHLGPDKLLLDNSIMQAFRAVLDWEAEKITFKGSEVPQA